MSTATATQSFDLAEPIPGYRTQERIGAGGYGEVWKAEAPGGIAKAIKVVFGCREAGRAEHELSALNRIKEVRHPFLLSLERIELIDGHLVIVAELATSSMRTLFDQYRHNGVPGIPRGELLGYLRDAAEALDYICQVHSLQHLDIKPENLLLVGGRIKVADFGQVKDLQNVNCSIVSGMTPIYAAPELFDGRPNSATDQYALAIVYQEMLTGALPFDGRTTAQLAAQHLHSRPRLDFLPASDQATIGRALSKDPAQRFSTCCDMLHSLLEVTPNNRFGTPRVSAGTPGYCQPLPAPSNTEVLPSQKIAAAAGMASGPRVTSVPDPAPPVRDLPPIEIRPDDVLYGPAVFVGIGGLAAKALQSLRRRLVERFPDVSGVPALQMLLLDTDSETLETVTDREARDSLPNDAVLLLPLRQAADYRHESSDRLHWLSRRWIYNIPRSGQTEGFRPLGRLAFVDHFERVSQRMERVIQAATDPEGLIASARATGLAFQDHPLRVFIVSSISGGTGSGMALDVAYLARKVLRDRGLSQEGVYGILAHCVSRNPQIRDLAVANAYAFLGELRHYSDPQNAYPGARACDLPAFAPQDAPFNHAYVVDLGEDVGQDEFAAAADKLAKYLYCNTVTRSAAFFDKCRGQQQAEGLPASADPTVRTFGLSQLGFSHEDIPAAAIDELCKSLLARWRGIDHTEPEEDRTILFSDPTALLATQAAAGLSEEELRTTVTQRTKEAGLDVQRSTDQLRVATASEMGTDAESYLLAVLGELLRNGDSGNGAASDRASAQSILDALGALIRFQGAPDPRAVCLESVLEKHLEQMAVAQATPLRQWLLELVASPKYRVGGAQRAAHFLAEHLRAMSRQTSDTVQGLVRELHTLEQSLLGDEDGSRGWLRPRGFGAWRKLAVDKRLLRYFTLRIEELTLNGVCRLFGLILAQVAAIADKLRNLAAELNRMAEAFGGPTEPTSAAPKPPGRTQTLVAETVKRHKSELVADMEHALEDDLRGFVRSDGGIARSAFCQALRSAASSRLTAALRNVRLPEMAAAPEQGGQEPELSSITALKAATPRLSNCGGARRLLLATSDAFPPGQVIKQLQDELREAPTVVTAPDEDVLLCYEVQELPLRRVAAALLDGRLQSVEVAARLHTRTDVPWTPF